MENCLVTKLKGTVDNNSLKRFNRIRVRLAFPGERFSYLPTLGSNQSGIAGEKISGLLFKDYSRTQPVEKELPIYTTNYYRMDVYNGDQINNPNKNISFIDLAQNNIWLFNCDALEADILGKSGSVYVWFNVDWEALCGSSVFIINISTMYLLEGQEVNIEDYFVSIFRRVKAKGNTQYEDASIKAYFPGIINAQTQLVDSQKRILFNNNAFYNKRLFMSTDINNDEFTLYDTGANFDVNSGYNISNPVASYNNSTDEWTYNS